MIDDKFAGELTDEGFSHQPMNEKPSSHRCTTGADLLIAIRGMEGFQYRDFDAADSPEVADFVKAFPSDYRTPLFIGYDFGSCVGHDHSMSDAVSGLPMFKHQQAAFILANRTAVLTRYLQCRN